MEQIEYFGFDIAVTEDGTAEGRTIKLSADKIDYMDNISVKWLPEDIDKVLEKLG